MRAALVACALDSAGNQRTSTIMSNVQRLYLKAAPAEGEADGASTMLISATFQPVAELVWYYHGAVWVGAYVSAIALVGGLAVSLMRTSELPAEALPDPVRGQRLSAR